MQVSTLVFALSLLHLFDGPFLLHKEAIVKSALARSILDEQLLLCSSQCQSAGTQESGRSLHIKSPLAISAGFTNGRVWPTLSVEMRLSVFPMQTVLQCSSAARLVSTTSIFSLLRTWLRARTLGGSACACGFCHTKSGTWW
jgi:hypothetical protein